MRITTHVALQLRLNGTAVFVAVLCSVFPGYLEGQINPGQNAVCTSSMGCSTTVGTKAFIDASMFLGGGQTRGSDICDTIFKILTGATGVAYPPSGAVVDARGIIGTTNLTCAKGSPWAESSNSISVPATILLPAGTIVIPTTWVLPTNTTLTGEGDNLPSSTGAASSTTLQACKQSINNCPFAGTDMMDLGNSTLCPLIGGIPICNSVSVQNLVLDGLGQSINGIVNTNAQTGTYLDHVSLYQILGTGLSVSSSASDSGPFSNITFDTGAYSGGICASINGLSGTRGIRGLSCTNRGAEAGAAVFLDSSNNFIKDVTITGFHDGISVGTNASAKSNVLVNINGETKNCNPICGPPINTVHIEGYTTNGKANVADISIVGASNDGAGTVTIADDLTSTNLSDSSVGIYALGEPANNGYARFTTSSNVASWATGTTVPIGSCAQGSLYSCTNSVASSCNSKALWGCQIGATTWSPIK